MCVESLCLARSLSLSLFLSFALSLSVCVRARVRVYACVYVCMYVRILVLHCSCVLERASPQNNTCPEALAST